MITVDDGVRRLRLLDAKGKVWTQEMLLQVEDKAVSLIDLDSQVGRDVQNQNLLEPLAGSGSARFSYLDVQL